MSNQTGLSDPGRFEAFISQWRGSVLKEAEKWCSDEKIAQLLAEAVLSEFRNKYADREPPRNPEYYLRAQVCLLYSQTGPSARRLNDFIAAQELAAEAYIPQEQSAPEAQTPPPVQPQPPVQPEPSPAVHSETVPVQPQAPAPAPEPEPAPVKAEAPAAPPETGSPTADKAPEKKNDAPPDTFFDPVRTTLWTPDSDRSTHVVKELVIPDEEDDGRSVLLSFVNTVLFVLTAGAFGFCIYETGFLQYLMQ